MAIKQTDESTLLPKTYYITYHVLAGMIVGLVAAASSLLFNVIASTAFGKHPLQLIRVYLTFPVGEKALAFENGFALAAGCCLYLGTGSIGGIPFRFVLSRYFADARTNVRLAAATMLAIGVWLINFYGVLSWLQPMLTGGRWIVSQVPLVEAVATHLVFGWTFVLVDHLAQATLPAFPTSEPSR